jgi:hypothetical protein
MRYAQAAFCDSLHVRAGYCGMCDYQLKQFIRWAPEGATADGGRTKTVAYQLRVRCSSSAVHLIGRGEVL